MLLLLDASPASSLPSAWSGVATAHRRWSLSEVADGRPDTLAEVHSGLTDPGALLLVDVTTAQQAHAALRQLSVGAALARPWLALLPAGAQDDAEAWWGHGAFDAVARDDTVALNRALRRAQAWARGAGQVNISPELQALQAQVHAMQASLDNIPTPIFAKNAEGVYTGCNQAFVEFLRLPREQIVGKTVYDVAPPHLASVYEQADRQLLASGGRQVYEAQVRWADGSLHDVIFHKAVFHDGQGSVAGQAGAIFDITDRKRLELGLRELAQTDSLTGLLNRRCFIERASAVLDQARAAGGSVCVLLFDIDHFKQLNDSHGHAAGDAMLCHLARRSRELLHDDDLFARIGGDEFAILLAQPRDTTALAHAIPARLAATPLPFEGRDLPCAVSLGAAVVAAGAHDIDSALRQADAALYEAKRQGRGRAVVSATAG